MHKEASAKTIYLKDYQVPPYLIKSVELDFNLQDKGTRVKSKIHFYKNPKFNATEKLILNGETFITHSLKVDGVELTESSFEKTESELILFSPKESFVFESDVELAPEENTALEGLYRSGDLFCTQCEAEGFRRITWFLDRPDVMSCFTTRIEADKATFPILLSNGNPQQVGDLDNARHFAIWQDPHPKPAYLFALVAGDLVSVTDTFETLSGKTVDLAIYVEAENIDKCDHAMTSLIKSMQWDEEKYGREYDLEVFNIVAVNDFNMGAMENKGLNVFNSKYVLASPDTATDKDFQGIEAVIAHEYFHNWTGNRVTCRDWFQLSLKEGLTVFRDQEFSADMGSRGVKRIEDVAMLRSHQYIEDAGPMAHPIRPQSYMEINNFYTVTVYEKGAEVVRMQATLLGEDAYRKATDYYFEQHDGSAVTTEDFVAAMEYASGRDLTQFKHWYDYAGTPELKVEGIYNSAAQTYTLDIQQSVPDTPKQTNKPAFHIPVAIGLLDQNGKDLIGTKMLELTQAKEQFVFDYISEKPIPSLLRGFSAPVKLSMNYTDDELMFLMAKDSDGFNRWNASQQLAQRLLLGLIDQRHQGEGMELPDAYIDSLRVTLLSENTDNALIAEIVRLPSQLWLGEQMETIDVDGIFVATEHTKSCVADVLNEDLLNCFDSLRDEGEYQVDSNSIGQRALKNVILSYLSSGKSTEVDSLLLEQYGASNNMTDVLSSLNLIINRDMTERHDLLADFADKWKSDVLVMDKWFAVQAMATNEDTLDNVINLMSHESFSIKNPNKVRALIGSFVAGNPVRFHAKDGSGYQFLTDQLIELDSLNPQIASRLLRNLSRWKRYDSERQLLMKTQLERMLSKDKLSKDCYEIASKSLEQ